MENVQCSMKMFKIQLTEMLNVQMFNQWKRSMFELKHSPSNKLVAVGCAWVWLRVLVSLVNCSALPRCFCFSRLVGFCQVPSFPDLVEG